MLICDSTVSTQMKIKKHVKHCIMSILICINKNFVLNLNAFEFKFELLIHLELMLCEATCIFII
jgi:hypothetical protein